MAWKIHLDQSPKADTYKVFKDKTKFEPYLSSIKNRTHRVALAKLRLSDHCLMIEKGRHRRPKLDRNLRFCPFCPGQVEDEEHFLTQCMGYNREELLVNIVPQVPNFININLRSQFIYLMTQESDMITYKLALTVNKWLTERKQFQADLEWLQQFF